MKSNHKLSHKIAYFHHFKEPLFGSRLELALLLVTNIHVFATEQPQLTLSNVPPI